MVHRLAKAVQELPSERRRLDGRVARDGVDERAADDEEWFDEPREPESASAERPQGAGRGADGPWSLPGNLAKAGTAVAPLYTGIRAECDVSSTPYHETPPTALGRSARITATKCQPVCCVATGRFWTKTEEY